MIYTKYILFSLLLVCPSVLSAQGITRRIHQIDEVTVWGKRPMKEIGVQKTKFDSLALKENIALSMADILTFNSSVFVKSYGRATLSTVAFRGTSPSHTQVTWNGMRINNPMLGMTDFSTIPSYFIDQASLLHGTSSVNETGGGLGGLVYIATVNSTWNCAVGVAGAGFLALAVMIFGQWKPLKIAAAALLFGFFQSLSYVYMGFGWLSSIPHSGEILKIMPYVVSLIVLAFTSGKSRAPKAEGIPYDKGMR